MRNTSTFRIKFILRKNKAKEDSSPIYVRITVDTRRLELSLKQSILPDNWDPIKTKAKGNSEEAKSLNHYLDEVHARLIEHYQTLQIQKELITADAIKNMFLGIDQKDYTLRKLIEYHNQVMEPTLARGTLKNYFTTQKYINEFMQEKYTTSDVFLCKLNYKFITDFEYFLRNRKPLDHQRPLNNNGVMKHLERLRKMVNMAVKMEWIDKDPFEKYQLKFTHAERGYLTENELAVIENKTLRIERLCYIRDLFVFSCYTGLPYIDVMKLRPANIILGIDGEYWISTRRQKTDEPVRVPILPVAWTMIEKYKNHPRSLNKGTVFPYITNQRLNSYLKELADLCGIDKNLSFHLARHTFATTITLNNGVPIESVSKMLGHSRITTTQIYARVIERKVSDDMNQLREKMHEKMRLKNAK
jgi:site-specific recombinase XerD